MGFDDTGEGALVGDGEGVVVEIAGALDQFVGMGGTAEEGEQEREESGQESLRQKAPCKAPPRQPYDRRRDHRLAPACHPRLVPR